MQSTYTLTEGIEPEGKSSYITDGVVNSMRLPLPFFSQEVFLINNNAVPLKRYSI